MLLNYPIVLSGYEPAIIDLCHIISFEHHNSSVKEKATVIRTSLDHATKSEIDNAVIIRKKIQEGIDSNLQLMQHCNIRQ